MFAGLLGCRAEPAAEWTPAEQRVLRSLWIGSLPPPPPDPSNRVADDPRAAALGRRLFFDRRLSGNGRISCADCHLPERSFQDGLPLGRGVGIAARRTMTIAGSAYSPFLFWDGRKDSAWSQALAPLESPVEQGGDRVAAARLLSTQYRAEYEVLFGRFPDLDGAEARVVSRVFANLGKAIAAYERKVVPGPSRFDEYVAATLRGAPTGALLGDEERRGLRLFLGKAKCATCHGGPLFTDHAFHNTGVPTPAGRTPDQGRAAAIPLVKADEFNCAGPYSDAGPESCAELRFILIDDTQGGAFRAPTLRNVTERAPFMHAGQLATVRAVLEHYDRAPAAAVGKSELRPLGLSHEELAALEAFLRALAGPVTAPTDA